MYVDSFTLYNNLMLMHQEQRRADQSGNKLGVSQQVEPDIGLTGGSDSLPAAFDINVGLSEKDSSNTDTIKEVRIH